jgi:hypothetical protein
MAKHLLVIMSNAASGRDAEYNEWYTNTHLADVLKVEGFAAAQRFELSSHQVMKKGPYEYMALYEVETDDLKKTLDALNSGAANMTLSDSLDMKRTVAWAFSPCSDRLEA